MENRRSRTRQMRCKKHPRHKQSPGVCSICLVKRLSQLSSSKKTTRKVSRTPSSSSLSSLSSCDSSSNASSCASPNYCGMGRSEGKGWYVSFFNVSGKNVILTKSRSLEFYPPRPDREHANDDYQKNKGGFWSKLIGLSRRNKMDCEGLMHSKTMRESVSKSTGVH
ncbi:hypothetical protein OROGR_017166 [Orobanche gracilis]